MKVDLKALIHAVAEASADTFREDGEVRPLYHVVTKEGNLMVIPPPPLRKEVSIALMRTLMEASSVVAYVFVDEAWALAASMDEELPDSLENHPRRREVIYVTGEDENGQLFAEMEILRPKKGKPTLGPLKMIEHSGSIEGRMVGLLGRRDGQMVQ